MLHFQIHCLFCVKNVVSYVPAAPIGTAISHQAESGLGYRTKTGAGSRGSSVKQSRQIRGVLGYSTNIEMKVKVKDDMVVIEKIPSL